MVQETPTAATGRTLTPEKTGDRADWIEIATNAEYSLIVRTQFINTYLPDGHYNEPLYQYTPFGQNGYWMQSRTREQINAWFAGLNSQFADNLPPLARMREFTVKNDATSKLGRGTQERRGRTDSFSKPTSICDPVGPDVAFALSFAEAALLISKSSQLNGVPEEESSTIATVNFERLDMPKGDIRYDKMWLRSPGWESTQACALFNTGKAFQAGVNGGDTGFALVYPALWVNSAIFEECLPAKPGSPPPRSSRRPRSPSRPAC
jgi:hypothetical protein